MTLPTMLERFIEKLDIQPDGCWLWTGSLNNKGYGQFGLSGERRLVYAHRWSYEHFVGPIPDGLELDHLCRTHACVHPRHLEAVTHAENMRRGMSPVQVAIRLGVCINGHTQENPAIIHRSSGKSHRRCRTCAAAAKERFLAKKALVSP